MKKKILIIGLLIMSLIMVGCGNSIVKKSIEQAKTAVENKEYDKALASLQLVFDEDKDNEEANKLYSIIDGYKKAKNLVDENKIIEAKEVFDEINSDYINYKISEDIDDLKGQIDIHLKEVENITMVLSEAENMFNNAQYSACKTYIYTKILGSQEDNIEPNKYVTDDQKAKAEDLVKKSDEEMNEIEAKRIAEEKKKQEEAEAAEREKEDQSMTPEKAIEKIRGLNDLSYYRDMNLSFIPNDYKPFDLEGYGYQVGINGEMKFETIGHYFVSSIGKTFKLTVVTGEYEPVN